MKVSILTTAGLVLLSPSVYANNDLTQNELRVRRNQLVITDATPLCDVNMLQIRGFNLGSQKPHVTLALLPLDVLNEPVPVASDVAGLQEVVAVLPDAFCDNPASDLLTVMRTKMKYRRRWVRLTKKDLATSKWRLWDQPRSPTTLSTKSNKTQLTSVSIQLTSALMWATRTPTTRSIRTPTPWQRCTHLIRMRPRAPSQHR